MGKGVTLRLLRKDELFMKQAVIFTDQHSTKEDVVQAGDKAIVCMYKGKPDDDLDGLRYRLFNQKVAKSTKWVHPRTLPPTEAAMMYHSLLVYHQVQVWIGRTNMDPLEWGWKNNQGKLVPIMTHLPPARKDLLEVVACNCKRGCLSLQCTCRKHGLPCTLRCGECHGVCSNTVQIECDLYAEGDLGGDD